MFSLPRRARPIRKDVLDSPQHVFDSPLVVQLNQMALSIWEGLADVRE